MVTYSLMDHPHSEIINRLGGNGAVAKLCKVTSQAVSKWRRDGFPSYREDYLRLARPEAFSEPGDATKEAA